MKWKKLKSTEIFSHPRITLYEDDVELPSGKKTKYLHFGSGQDSGMVLALNQDGKFLIQKEYSYPVDEVLYQLPGGAINPGEDPVDGARREFAEETSLTGDLQPLGWLYTNNRRSGQKMHVYLATNLSETSAHKDEEELFEDHWLTEAEVDHKIATNEICNYTLLAGWALYKAHVNPAHPL